MNVASIYALTDLWFLVLTGQRNQDKIESFESKHFKFTRVCICGAWILPLLEYFQSVEYFTSQTRKLLCLWQYSDYTEEENNCKRKKRNSKYIDAFLCNV